MDIKIVVLSKDFPITSDLDDMINESDVVVIGEYKNFDSKWNMARNPENLMEEDTENYTEGHLYNFDVSEIVQGELSDNQIKVNHRFAETIELEESNEIINSDGTIKKEATEVVTEKIKNEDPFYIKPVTEKSICFS